MGQRINHKRAAQNLGVLAAVSQVREQTTYERNVAKITQTMEQKPALDERHDKRKRQNEDRHRGGFVGLLGVAFLGFAPTPKQIAHEDKDCAHNQQNLWD